MKYKVHIDRLVIDRGLGNASQQPAWQQQVAQAVRRRIAQAAPQGVPREAQASLDAGIARALQQAEPRGRKP